MASDRGLSGMQYGKKSFSVYGDGVPEPHNIMSDEDKAKRDEAEKALRPQTTQTNGHAKPKKKIVPFGNRFILKRRRVGEKLGSGILIAADETKDRPVDLADVVTAPELTFADKAIIDNADKIAAELGVKASQGDNEALKGLLEFRAYLQYKSIKVGDTVFINKYAGTDFSDKEGNMLTVCGADDICGIVRDL